MKSKHMSSGTVAAAGNDIRGSLADFRGPLTFPRLGLLVIYDFVRSSFSAMFHCKNNKTARQNQTGNPKKERKKRERELEGLLLTTSVRARPASTAEPSVPQIRVCGYELLWWLQIYGDALLIAPIGGRQGRGGGAGGGGRMRSFSQFGTIYIWAGSGHASLRSKRGGSDLQSNESVDDNWINLCCLDLGVNVTVWRVWF